MEQQLKNGLNQLGIAFDETQLGKLLSYVELLNKWNKVYNLTAVRKPRDMLSLHLLDSLSLLPYLNNSQRVLDLGSGAGLPGIPLAIFQPERRFVLLDSNNKKTRFIQQVIASLTLENVQVVHERVEKYSPEVLFDCITTRAFATIAETLTRVEPLLEKQAQILFMKSNTANTELNQLQSNFNHKIIDLIVPGINAYRCLVVLSR